MAYVIQRDNGKFVARQDSKHSYTDKLQHARPFAAYEDAKRECCGNERVRPVDVVIYTEGT